MSCAVHRVGKPAGGLRDSHRRDADAPLAGPAIRTGGSALQVTGRSFTRQVGVEAPFDLLVKLSTCKWDLNADGKVCQEDLGQLLSQYGSVYNQADLGELLAQYDGGCGDPC